VIIAGIALQALVPYGFRTAQPTTAVGDDGVRIDKYSFNSGLCHAMSSPWYRPTLTDASQSSTKREKASRFPGGNSPPDTISRQR
jgi:hypothetical protein